MPPALQVIAETISEQKVLKIKYVQNDFQFQDWQLIYQSGISLPLENMKIIHFW